MHEVATSKEETLAPRNDRISVSVIIVSWNACDYLIRCLETIFESNSRYSLRVVVVDNFSSDRSVETVRERFPDVVVICNDENLGFSTANNIGMKAYPSDYFCLINSDVEVFPGCIDRLVEYLEVNLSVGMVGPRILNSDGSLQRSCRGFPNLWNMFCCAFALDGVFSSNKYFCGYALLHWDHSEEREIDILSGCFWVARGSAIEEVGFLDENFFIYGEDMDWCKRFWSAGWPLAYVPGVKSIHHGGASSANSPVKFYVEKQKADLQYWKKHHAQLELRLYFLIALVHNVLRVIGYSLLLPFSPRHAVWRCKIKRSVACIKWMLQSSSRSPIFSS